LLQLLVAVAGATGSTAAQPPPLRAALDLFETLATTQEGPSLVPAGVQRWSSRVSYVLLGRREAAVDDAVEAQLLQMSRLTGVAVRKAPLLAQGAPQLTAPAQATERPTGAVTVDARMIFSADTMKGPDRSLSVITIGRDGWIEVFEANFLVFVLEKAEFNYLAEAIPLEPPLKRGVLAGRIECAFRVVPHEFRIVFATVFIRRDVEPWLLKRCVAEELSQAFGLINDAPGSAMTLFDDKPSPAKTRLLPLDELMFRALYDRRIPLGSKGQRFRSAAEPVLRELLAAFDKAD